MSEGGTITPPGPTPSAYLEAMWDRTRDRHVASFLSDVMGGNSWHSLCSNRGGRFYVIGFYRSPSELQTAAAEESERGADVWYGVHGMAEKPSNGRGGDGDVVEVRCLVGDLDWADEAHKGADLPAEQDVRGAVARFEHPPSYVVETGHGLQAYWLLGGHVAPGLGAELTARLHSALAAVGLKPEGADLARLLRVPGTLNRKREPVEVTVTEVHPERRYIPEYLDSRLPKGTRSAGTPGAGGHWRPLDRAALHPLDLEVLEVLEGQGWHGPYLAADGTVQVVRPGKKAGNSASIGFSAPGTVKIFSSAADSRLTEGRVYDLDELLDLFAGRPASKNRLWHDRPDWSAAEPSEECKAETTASLRENVRKGMLARSHMGLDPWPVELAADSPEWLRSLLKEVTEGGGA